MILKHSRNSASFGRVVYKSTVNFTPLEASLGELDPVLQQKAREAIQATADLHEKAQANMTEADQKEVAEKAAMVQDAAGRAILETLMDRSFRSKDPELIADEFASILHEHGIPKFFSGKEKMMLKAFQWIGRWFPKWSVPLMKKHMQKKTSKVLLPGEQSAVEEHIKQRGEQGVRLNFNKLGEAILGEEAADQKIADNIAFLEDPKIDCISLKVSNAYSQISSIAHGHSVERLVEKLEPLLDAAVANKDKNGNNKLVNFDMEEYRDMSITVAAFKQLLEKPKFKDLQAGIALQAYIPDSAKYQRDLIEWSRKRVADGGAPIRIRIVKGANLSMEKIEASRQHSEQAPYDARNNDKDNKIDVDANWKNMVEFGTRPENARVCHVGIATHNLLDMKWAEAMVKERGVEAYCVQEMLEGMINFVIQQIESVMGKLMYAPVAKMEDFLTAIAYLMRRFSEQSDPNNFLSSYFGLEVNSEKWNNLCEIFIESLKRKDTVSQEPQRTQNRNLDTYEAQILQTFDDFRNSPNTDWALEQNRDWLENVVYAYMKNLWEKGAENFVKLDLPMVEGEERQRQECFDRSEPDKKIAEVELANRKDIGRSIERASEGAGANAWRDMDSTQRDQILANVAVEMEKARGELMGAAAADTGKAVAQGDPEVSEGVDFANLYPLSARYFRGLKGVKVSKPKKSTVVVESPWNFPIAIPAGGILAALAAGKTVILKPSPKSLVSTYRMAQVFWAAGVPRDVLQVVPCSDADAGELVSDDRVESVIYTGGTEVANKILKKKPNLDFYGETGGKDVTIITNKADREQAIQHLIASLKHNGQKCSATSLAILTKDVYNDPQFQKELADAVKSLPVGSAHDPASVITPLIHAPNEKLLKGLTTLEPGQSWLVKPEKVDGREDLWRPGIRIGTTTKHSAYTTEYFGPVIDIMLADNLEEAVKMANETGFGLTFNIETLDDKEYEYAKERMNVGVFYRNGDAGSTAADAFLKPFGGATSTDSRYGPGIHAGGKNYVTNMMDFENDDAVDPDFEDVKEGDLQGQAAAMIPLVKAWEEKLESGVFGLHAEEMRKSIVAVKSYLYEQKTHFSQEHRPNLDQHVRGQDNIHRYKSIGTNMVRIHGMDSVFEVMSRIAASFISGNKVLISGGADSLSPVMRDLIWEAFEPIISAKGSAVEFQGHSDFEVALMLKRGQVDQIRYAGKEKVPNEIFEAAQRGHVYVSHKAPLKHGRIELLRTHQEQTISDNYHRFGGGMRKRDDEAEAVRQQRKRERRDTKNAAMAVVGKAA